MAGHPWVFSNEVDATRTPLKDFAAGQVCIVRSHRDAFLGYAHVNPHTLICARLLSRDSSRPPGPDLWRRRLQAALNLRRRIYERPFFRLVHAEADRLPGLVLDLYGDVVVGQIGTAGMERQRPEIEAAIAEVVGPAGLLWKNDGAGRELEGLKPSLEVAAGTVPDTVELEENGVRFTVPLRDGQKTGWFFDQEPNRTAFLAYVRGARVLDVFSYLGAWGLGTAAAGASMVRCVDSSATALDLLRSTAARNALRVEAIHGDAFDVLVATAEAGESWDAVVLDPPAFIRRRRDAAKGAAAYRRLNELALRVLAPDAFLVSCSCSYHLSIDDHLAILRQVGRRAGRFLQVLHIGGQGPDHPVHPALPESRYLTAIFCRVLGG